jgi:hypothetical protein
VLVSRSFGTCRETAASDQGRPQALRACLGAVHQVKKGSSKVSYSPGRTGGGSGGGGDPAGTAAAAAASAQAYAIQRANHTGTQSSDTLTDGTTSKVYPAADKTKLAGVAAGATVNSPDATLFARANHTGTQSSDTLTDGTTSKVYPAADKTKLAGIAAGATANSPDATLLARANHTGTQSADSLTDGTTNKVYPAADKTKLAGVAAGATANSPDATLLNRANHSGSQPAASVSGLAAVATSGAYADLTGAPTATPVAVVQYTGSLTTARPNATMVFWMGFPSQPTNMADPDVLFGPADPVFDRSTLYGPTGTVRANLDRSTAALSSTIAPVSGTLYLSAIYLFAGDVITNLNIRIGTTAITLITHSWAVLTDASRNVLAVSADDTTNTGSLTTKTFPLGTAYTVPTSGLYYVGVMIATNAGTATVVGAANQATAQQNIPPITAGSSGTALTTPPNTGTQMTAITPVANIMPYIWAT